MASGKKKDLYSSQYEIAYVTFPNNAYNLSHHCTKVI